MGEPNDDLPTTASDDASDNNSGIGTPPADDLDDVIEDDAPITNAHPRVDEAFARWADARQTTPGYLTWRIAIAIALSHDLLQGSPHVRTVEDVNDVLARCSVPVLAHHMHMRRQSLGPNTLASGSSMLFDPEHNGCRPRHEPDYPEKWLWLEVHAGDFYEALHDAAIVRFAIGTRFVTISGHTLELIAYAPDHLAALRDPESNEIVEIDARELDSPALALAASAGERQTPDATPPSRAVILPPQEVQVTVGAHRCRTCGRAPEGGLVDRNGVPLGWKQLGTLQPEGILIEFCSACFNAIRNL